MKINIKLQFLQNQITIFVLSKQLYNKKISQNFSSEDSPESVLGFSVQNQIYLNEQNMPLGIIIHEIVHAVDFIMEHHDIENKEIRAYLTQYVFKQTIKKIKRSLPNKDLFI